MHLMKLHLYILQKIGLALSIIVVLNLFFNYGIYTFYSSPKYEDFCAAETRKYYDNKESCESIGGEWTAHIKGPYGPYPPRVAVPAIPEGTVVVDEPTAYCNATATCQRIYEEDRNLYNRNVFITLVSLGVISIIAGFFLVSVSAISSGLLFGGLISIFVGNIRYWSDMNEYLRLAVLAIALATLLWLGYKKLKDK